MTCFLNGKVVGASQSRSAAEDTFMDFAKELELNVEQFEQDIDLSEGIIDAHYQSGLNAGVNSTPSFYLNGVKVEPRTLQDFKDLLDNQAN